MDLPTIRAATTSRSRRRCCRSTASSAPTRCSARRCARPARSWASPPTSRPRSPRPRPPPASRCPRRHRLPHRHRLRQAGGARAWRRLLHDLGFRIVATARHGGGDRAHGHPGRAPEQDRRGLAARGRLDRARRRRPRHQHPDGHRRARSDGYEIRRAAVARGIPCITTMSGGMAAARAIASARQRRRAGALAAGDPRAARQRAGGHVTAGATRESTAVLAPLGTPLAPTVAAARAARRLRRPLRWPIRTGRRREPGQFYMLAAAERWGGGADERPFLPRAFSRRARARRRHAGLHPRGRRAGHQPACRTRARATGSGCSGRSASASGARATGAAPVLCGGGDRDRAARDLAGRARRGHARSLLGFRDARSRRRAPRCSDAARSPPTTARSATTGS